MQNTKLHRFGVKENINIKEIFKLHPALSVVEIVCENITFFYLRFTLIKKYILCYIVLYF